jgi:DNA replication protein DnaC
LSTEERAEMYREWLQEETERRLKAFYELRPAVFAIKGDLDQRVYAWLETFMRGDATTLLLGGNTGTVKTWSAWKAIETLIYNGWRGGWEVITAYELMMLTAPPVDVDQLVHLTKTDLLVIDDIGSVKVTEWGGGHLFGLVDYRWRNRLPIVITSNVSDFDDLLGQRVTSRLVDGMAEIILGGPDRRRSA